MVLARTALVTTRGKREARRCGREWTSSLRTSNARAFFTKVESYRSGIPFAVPIWFASLVSRRRMKDGTDAQTLFKRFADARGREGAGGRQPPECCEGVAGGRVERDQMGSAIFRHGLGRSEPDGLAPRAEACGASGLDPWADQGLSGDHAGGAARRAGRTRASWSSSTRPA